MAKKVVVGLSGGVDSSVALLLLKRQGHLPIGLTLGLPVWEDSRSLMRENICCTAAAIRETKRLCLKLGVPHFVVEAKKEFQKKVVDYFVKEYRQGKTPNPCIICNQYFRFPKFFQFARKMKADLVATGHYARLQQRGGKYELLQAKDKSKDQSYFLALLGQKDLNRLLFPLGDHTKKGVYKIAKKEGLKEVSQRPQSQEFCFVSGQAKEYFLADKIGKNPGPILAKDGQVLGQHQGLHFYTIGQRKGIKLGGGPHYVVAKDSEKNALIVSRAEKDLLKKELRLKKVNWLSGKKPRLPLRVQAKIRYRHQPALAVLATDGRGGYRLKFTLPQRAITPGQFAVFYQAEVCLGGGVIAS